MKLKLSLVLLALFATQTLAIDVLVSKDNIQYKEKISSKKLRLSQADKVHRLCEPFTLEALSKNVYIAKRYINKNSIICTKDVKIYKKESVVFDFGGIVIEKEGKVIFENDRYITIKKRDGSVEKIYKDGKLK